MTYMTTRRVVCVSVLLSAGVVFGWWDHPYITRCAWDAQPKELTAPYTDFERDEFCYHTMMSDYPRMATAGDFGYFQLWDFFMWWQRRARVDYANGGGEDMSFQRVLQAVKTETPLNALLWAGCFFHALEDSMSISHTALPNEYQGEWHGPCEAFAHWEKFNIGGYVAKPLAGGYDPAALRKELDRRIAEVNKRAYDLWPKMKLIIDENGIKQPPAVKAQTNERIDPYVMTFAEGVAKLAADTLCTFLNARREFAENTGAALEGAINAPPDPVHAQRTAKVYVRTVDDAPTHFETMAFNGRYAFRNLPDGTYRLAATRLGAKNALSAPFELKKERVTRIDLALETELPQGNLVWNPTGTCDLYGARSPDRWRMKPLFNWGPLQQDYWRTSFMHLEPGWTYRCGAKLKRPTTVRFRFAKSYGGHGPALELDLKDRLESEMVWTNAENFFKAKIEVVSTEPLTNLIEKVWFVPVPPKDWAGIYPMSDYVPVDDIFRQSLRMTPPQPEFWRRDPCARPPAK